MLVFLHFFLPAIVNAVHHAFTHDAPAVIQKPTPVHTAPVPPPPPPPEQAAATKHGGVWQGDTLMPNADRCAVKLGIRLSDELPKKLKGYSTVRCMPLQTLARGPVSRGKVNEMVRDYAAPATAVMTGTPQESGLTFTIDPAASPASNGCAITGFNIVDFGQGQVMANWEEGTCPSGRMLLRKARG